MTKVGGEAMAKYKPYSYAQGQLFIPGFFNKQYQKGTFEYSLSYLVDNEPDLSLFDKRFNNDETGAPAYDLRVLLKVVLFAYSSRITSSRSIARTHFTTIADFISSMDQEMNSFDTFSARGPEQPYIVSFQSDK
jgi:hypothetical protein